MPSYALSFNGDATHTSYVQVKAGAILSGLTNYSIGVWFNTSASTSGPLYCERPSAGNDILKLELQTTGNINFAFRDDVGVLNQNATPGAYKDGNVHHCVLVKSGVNITIYVDNVSVKTAILTASDLFTNGGNVSRIGGDNNDSTQNYHGIAEDVKLWNTALAAGDVTTEYTGGNVSSGQIDWWAFDEGTGTSAADSTGSNTGTLAGSRLPTWVKAINPYDPRTNQGGGKSHLQNTLNLQNLKSL